MCSIPAADPDMLISCEDIERLGRAIDELASTASGPGLADPEVPGRLARAWGMVASLDPELARRVAGYAD